MPSPKQSVTRSDNDLWDFTCPHTSGCGDDAGPFRSTGWPTRQAATERGEEHLTEHTSSKAMPELAARDNAKEAGKK